MTIIRLDYKGSASSGNRMHAGRPGKVGGSMPKTTTTTPIADSYGLSYLDNADKVKSNRQGYSYYITGQTSEQPDMVLNCTTKKSEDHMSFIEEYPKTFGLGKDFETKSSQLTDEDWMDPQNSENIHKLLDSVYSAGFIRVFTAGETGIESKRIDDATLHRLQGLYYDNKLKLDSRYEHGWSSIDGKYVTFSVEDFLAADHVRQLNAYKEFKRVKIILGYKGSASSGNRMHAGRPGKVGGSMPRNYAFAIQAAAGLSASDLAVMGISNVANLQNLNRVGLQAIIDYQSGKISVTSAASIIAAPTSQRGVAAPVAPAPAIPTPTPPTPAPTPAGTVVLKPPYVPTAAELSSAKDMLAILQDPNNPRGAAHSSWAQGIDINNLTPNQVKVLNIYAQGKMRGVTLQNAMTQPIKGATTATAPPTAPTPPPPPPAPKDPRFYQGDLTGKSAEEIFNGSSKEVQDLALKYGILATDAKTLDYVKQHGPKFERDIKYIPSYEQALKDRPYVIKDVVDNRINSLATGMYDTPQELLSRFSSGSSIYNKLKPEERALADKMNTAMEHSRAAYSNNVNMVGWSKARDMQQAVIQQSWAGLSAQEKEIAANMMGRVYAANWVNNNVWRTLPTTAKQKWEPVTIDKVPTSAIASESGLKRYGWEYRGTFVKQQAAPTAGYTSKQVVALSSLSADREKQVRDQFDTSWDRVNHTFTGSITGAFEIHPQKAVVDKYNAAVAARDNVQTDLYHGTHYEAGVSIASNGYIVFPAGKAKTGRAMGDGIYLADRSSKSAQYIYSSGWGSSRAGVLLLNNAAKGTQVDRYGQYGNYDTVFGGTNVWKNNEWCVRDAGAVLPVVWIDISTQK